MRASMSSTALLLLGSLVLLPALVPACGGRTLLDDPADEEPIGNASSSGSGTGSGGASSGGSTSGGGSEGGDASTKSDASSSGGNASGTVTCGSSSCKSATQDCCTMQSATGMMAVASCVPKGQCTNGVVASCMAASDCASGDVCCASFGGTTGTSSGGLGTSPGLGTSSGLGGGAGGFDPSNVSVECKKSTCGTGGIQLCAKDSECASGVTCQASGFGPKICGGIGSLLGSFGGGTGGTSSGFTGLGGLTGH